MANTKEKEEKKVEVPVGFLETLQEQLQQNKAEIDTLRKDRDMLLMVADKSQMSNFYRKNQKELPSYVSLRSFVVETKEGAQEKVIVGWRTLVNQVFKVRPNVWQENQKIELIFEDGTKLTDLDYLYYVQNYRLTIKAKIIGRIKDEMTGDVTLKVQRDDNNQIYEIGEQFVN